MPGNHKYVAPPVAVSTEAPPKQMALGDADAFTFGKLLTVMVIVPVLLQPLALVAVTVYVVVAVGETLGVPGKLPGTHT